MRCLDKPPFDALGCGGHSTDRPNDERRVQPERLRAQWGLSNTSWA